MTKPRSSGPSAGSQTPVPSPSWEKTSEAGTAPWDVDEPGSPDEFARSPQAGSDGFGSSQFGSNRAAETEFGSGGQSGKQQFGSGQKSDSDEWKPGGEQQQGFSNRGSQFGTTGKESDFASGNIGKRDFLGGQDRFGSGQYGNASAGSQNGSGSGDLSTAAQDALGMVKEQASKFASGVGDQLTRGVEDQKKQGVDAIRGVARAIGSAADGLEGQSPQVARFVRDAAGQIESFSGNLENKSVGDLVQQVTSLARSNPTLFIAGALAAGFALSRFIKSSAASSSMSSSQSALRRDDDFPSPAEM